MGVVTSLDFSLPDAESESGKVNWTDILKITLPYTNIFVPSLEEALKMAFPYEYTMLEAAGGDIVDHAPVDLIKDLGERLIAYGANIVLIKAAHKGLFLWTGDVAAVNRKQTVCLSEAEWNNRQLWCEAYPAVREKIINASGAGDTSAAAFLTAILNGEPPGVAMKYAAIAGKNNLYCNNIFEDMPGWAMMTKELEEASVEVKDIKGLLVNEGNNGRL